MEKRTPIMDLWREPDGLVHPEAMRAIAHAMFDVCHKCAEDGGKTDPQTVLSELALVSGMASGVLIQIADKMEKGWDHK